MRAIVVGSGAGGSVAAMTLAEAGWDVTVFEKGPNLFTNLAGPGPIGTVFSNDELRSKFRYFEDPDPLVWPRTFRAGADRPAGPPGSVAELPQLVGGGTVHWDAKTPRFWDIDFRQRSAFGPVPGADVQDWPLEYTELAPYYDDIEALIGVQGDVGAMPAFVLKHAPRSGPFPMPPGPQQRSSQVLADGARAMGWQPFPIPAAINSRPYDDRPACNNCGFCAMHGCPILARAGALAPLRRALRTGRVELIPDTMVTRVVLRGGRARGVQWTRLTERGSEDGRLDADVVVLAASAIETVRLALLSGLPDASGRLGQRLMLHFYVALSGIFLQERLHSHRGRAATQCIEEFADPDFDGATEFARLCHLPYLRGGLTELGIGLEPITEAKIYQRLLKTMRPGQPFGSAFKQLMRGSPLRDRMAKAAMVGSDLPYRENDVTLDPDVTDVYGLPVPRVTYALKEHERAAQVFYFTKIYSLIKAAGADLIGMLPLDENDPPDSVHVMGGMPMGADEATSVCDPYGRVHGTENVYVADASVFVTSGAQNPTLTLMALALRSMRQLAGTVPAARPQTTQR
jgi:choline dehydrogenase-like flavoprotein